MQAQRWPSIATASVVLASAAMAVALYMTFVWVPNEAEQGVVQRIFYFHVPLAWVSFLAFFLVFVGSIGYLRKRDISWDRVATSSAEIGVVFTTLVLITGSLWAKPIWGTWWTWDPRLTSVAVLWLIYVAYLMIRSYATEESQAARYGAVVGIVGFIDVPIVYLSIRWWRTLHPEPLIFGRQGTGLAPEMLVTLLVGLVAFTLLFVAILLCRVWIRQTSDLIGALQAQLEPERADLSADTVASLAQGRGQ